MLELDVHQAPDVARAQRRGPAKREPGHAMEAWLAAIVDSSDDAIIGKTLQGIITSWNKGAERLYGYSAAEVVGQSMARLIPADRPQELEDILTRLQRGERIDHYETVRLRKDGRLIEVSVTVSPIEDAAGRIVGASAIARDITDRKRLAVEQAARTRLEGALLTARTVQDRVQNQLSQTVGWAGVLAEDPALPSHLREAAVRALRGAEEASCTLRQLTQLNTIKLREWGPDLQPTINLTDKV
jgi:PAS domain S-box-containing protein